MSLTDDRIEELISLLQDLQGQEWGKHDYKMSREIFKVMERLALLEERYIPLSGVSDE